MTDDAIDLTGCDREPIHIPGSIQPHGMLLVCEGPKLSVTHAAGDIESRLGVVEWVGRPLADLIGADLAREAAASESPQLLRRIATARGEALDVSVHRDGRRTLIELEPDLGRPLSAAAVLAGLHSAAGGFERAGNLRALCERAAAEFRRLTGYDRVMIYRFLEDGAGAVLGEDRREDLQSFLNHHFPGSDIPAQARALYVRNLVRVIPDVSYAPAPLRPAWSAEKPLDMSDCALRSVSPIHLRYLKNMGVAASASMSIVMDGALWGLVACHHETPRQIPYEVRAACRALAGGLARQIKAKEEAEGYRERIRLRGFEDDIVSLLSRDGSLDIALSNHLGEARKMLNADGVAVLRGGELVTAGAVPSESLIRELAPWLVARSTETVFATDRLSTLYPQATAFGAVGSGVLAVTLSVDEPWLLIWFRAELVQVIEWAGNPHKTSATPGGVLEPRTSFDAWRETVEGRSRRWSLPEVEAAGRLRHAVLAVRANRRLRDLNKRLTETLGEKDLLLQQKEFLIGEVNHRVQNSLNLVSSFLGLQSRASEDPALHAALEEARRRLGAVALVHRRLYRADQIEAVDGARYIEELCADMASSMGEDWGPQLSVDLAPVMLPTDRAVTVGLILTELLINANKYAYGGGSGPIEIVLAEERGALRLSVADKGKGKTKTGGGFGTRMMTALVAQLGGEIEYRDNKPGLRAILTAPIQG